MKTSLIFGVQCVVSVALAPVTAPALAQSAWLDQEPNQFSLEMLRPSLDGAADLTAASFVTFATASVRAGERVVLIVELPYSRMRPDFGGAETAAALGNPYIGLRSIRGSEAGWGVETGVRLPLAADNVDGGSARWFGAMSSATDRMEAFATDLVYFDVRGRYGRPLGAAGHASARLGAALDIPLKGGGDPEIFALYGAGAWVRAEKLRIGTGFSGRMLLTENLDLGERELHEAAFWVDYDFGRIRPGVRLQVPVGTSLADAIDSVIGLTVQYRLGGA